MVPHLGMAGRLPHLYLVGVYWCVGTHWSAGAGRTVQIWVLAWSMVFRGGDYTVKNRCGSQHRKIFYSVFDVGVAALLPCLELLPLCMLTKILGFLLVVVPCCHFSISCGGIQSCF